MPRCCLRSHLKVSRLSQGGAQLTLAALQGLPQHPWHLHRTENVFLVLRDGEGGLISAQLAVASPNHADLFRLRPRFIDTVIDITATTQPPLKQLPDWCNINAGQTRSRPSSNICSRWPWHEQQTGMLGWKGHAPQRLMVTNAAQTCCAGRMPVCRLPAPTAEIFLTTRGHRAHCRGAHLR